MASQTAEAVQACIATACEGFARIDRKPNYWFRRLTPPLYSFIVVAHSTKFRCFELDVVSTVLPAWDKRYGTHQLRRATGLPNLREASGLVRMDEVAYKYTENLSEAMPSIGEDLRQFARPWFEAHRREMAEDELVQYGLQVSQRNTTTPVDVEELKQLLRKQADRIAATKWQRREISILAHDLLSWRSEMDFGDSVSVG